MLKPFLIVAAIVFGISAFLALSVIGLVVALGVSEGDGFRELTGGNELYYSDQMSPDEVDRVAEFIDRELTLMPGKTISFRIDRKHGEPRFGMVVLPGRHMDSDAVESCQEVARMVSEEVFEGAPVDFVMYDEWLNEVRVIEPKVEIDPLTYDPFQIDYDSLPRVQFSE